MFVFLCACQQKTEPETTTAPEITQTTLPEETQNYYEQFETETNYWIDDTDAETNQKSAETTSKSVAQTQKNNEETTKSRPITYYSESADNKYIKYIANKYSVDPSVLRALIRTNTDNRGATVLQFSGEKNSSGNLIMTEDTLVCVYDVDGNGKVMKATGKSSGYEGYSYLANIAAFKLAQEYIVPNIEATKAKRTYEDFFKN